MSGKSNVAEAVEKADPRTVCFVSPWFVPLTGGGQTRYARYLPGLRERGVDLEIFSGTPKPKKVSSDLIDEAWRAARPGQRLDCDPIREVPVHWYRLPDAGPLRTAWFGFVLLKHCLGPDRPAILQWMGEIKPGHRFWLRLIRRLGVKLVYTLMMAPDERMMTRDRATFGRLFATFDAVIANSSAGADGLRELGVAAPIEVIVNGVDRDRFRPPKDEAERSSIRTRLGFSEEDRIVLAVGAVSPRKGSDLLLGAWCRVAEEHANTHIIFVGARKDLQNPNMADFARSLAELQESSSARDRIHFMDYVPNVEEYMRAADVLVLASQLEGLPNSILEAHATSLPVIATPYHGLSPEIGEPGRHYALCARDEAELAAAIEEAIDKPEAARTRARAAYRELIPHLGYDDVLDRHATLYAAWSSRD